MRDPALTAHAKSMRARSTEPEQRMWLALRAKRFADVKFRRQKVIGPYIVDFAAREPVLVVEIDGDSCADRIEGDVTRTSYLEAQGYRVIRFANADVFANLDGVLATLTSHLGTLPLPTLSPEGERAI